MRNNNLRTKSGPSRQPHHNNQDLGPELLSFSNNNNAVLPGQHTPLRSKSGGSRSPHRSRSPQQVNSRGHVSSPLRMKSDHREPYRIQTTSFNKFEHEQSQQSIQRQSNKDLRKQYHRQINLCKQGNLNYYETATLVGYLLDLINISRKQEVIKCKMITNIEEFNTLDAFKLIEPKNTSTPGQVTQCEFRDTLLDMGVKPDRVTMDRVYLFFKRYNRSQNNLLRYSEF